MKPGEQREFSKGNGDAVVSAVGLRVARDGIYLRVDMTGEGGHTAVTEGAGAKNHPILFRDLRRMLIANGCWGVGSEGAEAQATGSVED